MNASKINENQKSTNDLYFGESTTDEVLNPGDQL